MPQRRTFLGRAGTDVGCYPVPVNSLALPPSPAAPSVLHRRGWLQVALLGAAGCTTRSIWAQTHREPVPVLYPEIAEPFRSVFETILNGIDERLAQRSLRLSVPGQGDDGTIRAELLRRRSPVVIALGKTGLRTALAVPGPINIIGGCVIGPAETDTRIASLYSLAPDPGLLLQRLKLLQPAIKRVHVVYSPGNSAWLVPMAQQAARSLGLELKAWDADDLRGAVQRYQEVLGSAQAHDALWLPQDTITVEESTVLPLVLREAWNRAIPLFSSNFAHVRRGALFALYPNNAGLGHSLGSSALAHLQSASTAPRGFMPLRDVYAGLNVRTASHLGIDYNTKLHGGFETLLPER